MGGTIGLSWKSNRSIENRIAAGKSLGYKEARTIIRNLRKDETIKFVTNSMGAAFERGFSEGLFQYRDERLITVDNDLLLANTKKSEMEQIYGKEAFAGIGSVRDPKTRVEKNYFRVVNKISVFEFEKLKLKDLRVEMVIDLSAHQIDYADPNAEKNYYMTAENNISPEEFYMGVDEKKHIRNSWYIGKMSAHHSSGADPKKFPKADSPRE